MLAGCGYSSSNGSCVACAALLVLDDIKQELKYERCVVFDVATAFAEATAIAKGKL
jgi:hypothetical protein